MKNTNTIVAALTIALASSAAANAERQFLRSAYELEDPSGYCLDIPGFGPRMRKDAPIGTHTCKYNRPGFSVDEEFEMTPSQHLRLPEYDLCLTAKKFAPGADVFTIDCASDEVHAWTMHANGRVTPSESSQLCLTLSSERTFVNSSPGNLVPNSSRAISLQACANGRRHYQSWRWSEVDEQDTPNANRLRSGMSRNIAAAIREMGSVVRAPETAAIYAAEPRMFTAADVSVSEEIAYGDDDGQRLQVYSGLNRNNPQNAAPVILLVHGGGFLRGGLRGLSAAATHFAGLGYIAVNMTYPLAPEATWPSGSQSVAAAVQWIKENAADIKGNADNIFVLGLSAGGAHVAEFVFRPELVEGESPTVAGAILGSPVVMLDSGNAAAAESPYFGAAGLWKDRQVLGNIERTSIPVLIITAEYDPPQLLVAATRLLSELVVDRGVATRFRQMRGHNHTSYIASVGTTDTQALEEILDFMATAGRE